MIINPSAYAEGYSNQFVCVCVSVCVLLRNLSTYMYMIILVHLHLLQSWTYKNLNEWR